MKVGYKDIINYSTTEQDTGAKWVDGSSLYRKTIPITTPAGTGVQSIPHGVTGIGEIVDHYGYVILSDGTNVPLPRSSTNMTTLGIYFYTWDATNVTGYVGTSYVTTLAIASGYLTIEYTKA